MKQLNEYSSAELKKLYHFVVQSPVGSADFSMWSEWLNKISKAVNESTKREIELTEHKITINDLKF